MKKVFIIDSGVGGLSIAKEINQLCAGLELIYIADSEALPYGQHPESYLIERIGRITELVSQSIQPDLIVTACNTASTTVLPSMRERFSVPIVGVVPAIKPAAQMSKSRVIGLLATEATVNRTYTKNLINEFAADCEVISVGSNKLVTLIEEVLRGQPLNTDIVNEILEPLIKHDHSHDLDTLVLGCTHFPLIKQQLADALKQHLDQPIAYIDSGKAIANRVNSLLGENIASAPTKMSAIASKKDYFDAALLAQLSQFGFQQFHQLSLSENRLTEIV